MAKNVFKAGQPRPANSGRKKGSVNKKTKEFMHMLEVNNFDPGEAMLHCYKEAMKLYERRREHRAFGPAVDALKLASGIADGISQFAYPKKRAIEHTGEVGVKTFADFMLAAKKKVEEKKE